MDNQVRLPSPPQLPPPPRLCPSLVWTLDRQLDVIDVGEGRELGDLGLGRLKGKLLVGNGGIRNLGGGKKVPKKCPG